MTTLHRTVHIPAAPKAVGTSCPALSSSAAAPGQQTRLWRGVASALALATLAGCAVQPTALTQQENQERTQSLLKRVNADQEPVTRPIDLYEAMARAIKYNLDYRVEAMDKAMRTSELEFKRMEMLPKLVASLDYTSRDNDSGGSSRSLLTGRTSLEPSTSSDRDVLASELGLSWDVLDFGLSYVRAQQTASEVLIAEERKRKTLVRIAEDVRTAYWRAAGAQRTLNQLDLLEKATQDALQSARAQAASQNTAPLAPLTYQREVLLIRREAQTLTRELATAKHQLAALMNLPPDTSFELALPAQREGLNSVRMSSAEMLRVAIENRPELREVAYQLRNNEWEATASTLRALPSLRLFLGMNWNSNDYLYNNRWVGGGAQASWNLMNLFRLPADKQRVKAQGDLLDARALALTTAVGVQVYVARARYELRLRELDTTTELLKVQQGISGQIESGYKAGRLSQQAQLREQLNSVVAEVRQDLALADLQNAFANVYASMGIDAVDGTVSSNDSVDILAGKLRDQWRTRSAQLMQAQP